jgi:hypothetical protein
MNAMKTKETEKFVRTEPVNTVIEAIKRDAAQRPELYVRNYRIPTEGE